MGVGQRAIFGRLTKYTGLVLLLSAAVGLVLISVSLWTEPHPLVAQALSSTFLLMSGVIALALAPILLASENSKATHAATRRQANRLLQEIEAHQRTDKELQKAKEAADARNLAKSKYIRGISHELRTPLNAVLGYAQLLESSNAVAPHLKHSVRVIRRSGDHLSNLVDGLLDISMIEAGRLQIYRDEVRLSDLLDQLVDMFSLQARENGLEFHFNAQANLPDLVYTDGKRLRQILINLLQNALRSTKQGRITLRISYVNQVARFDVEDTGIGISSYDLERIFRPFERIESSTHPAKHGTGLGLTITKLLTEAMGGEISVKSTPGKGSCFSVRLMLSPVSATYRIYNPTRNPVDGYQGPRRTLLIADDDPGHIGFMRDTLAALGFDILTAENGEACLTMAAQYRPDAVLLDISMPGMDGWETAHRLRAQSLRRIPIIIISADPRQETQRAQSAEDHDAYLMKPLRMPLLLDALKNLMGIEWIERPIHEAASARQGLILHAQENIPSAAHLRSLKQMGEIGHIRGILAKLDEIGQEEPQTGATLGHLRRIAEDCDLEGYSSFIESMMRHDA